MSKRHRRSNQQPQSPRQQPRAPRTRGALALADSSNPAQVTRLWTPAPMAGYGNNTQGDQQWGPGTSTGQTPAQQFFPNMPAVRDDKPLLTNIGASGTAIFSGVVTSEEYNPDFYWKDGIKIYEQMLRNDGQVNAVREIVEQPILRAEKHIVPGSSSARDQEIASFVETCLFEEMVYTSVDGISEVQTWDSLLRHILMHLWYGFMCFEQVWRIEDGWVKWARWTPLLPRTIWRWWVGNDNALTGVQQWTFREHNYQFVDIPAKKLVRFHRRLEGQNYEGVSALRSAYKHWFYKVQFEKIEAIGSERNAVIPAVIKLPEGFSQADYTNAQMIVANIRANESLGVTIPNTWDIEYLRNFQRQAVQLQDSIQYHDVMIARNMLAQFINLGSTETGAYSLDDSQRKDFLNNLQSICCSIEDTINLGPIRQLVDYNFDNVAVYPKLQFGKVLMSDLASLSDALSKLATAGFIHPDPQLEDYIREAGGLPSAPKSIVEAYNPTAPENASRPENANADNHQTQNPTQPQSQGTSNNGPDDGGDNGGGDGGGGGGMSLSESASASLREFRLLRESLDAFNAQVSADDAVERGVAYLFAGGGNPNHIPKGEPGAGQFAPGGAGGHGGEHSGHAVGAEHEGGHASKSGGGGGGGSGGSEHEGKSSSHGSYTPRHVANVDVENAARPILHKAFGRDLSDDEIASLVGAREHDSVQVVELRGDVKFYLDGRGYSAERTLFAMRSGPEMKNDSFQISPDMQGGGTGTHIFADQVRACRALGVHRIDTFASRGVEGHNGYYTWPRLGYNAKIDLGLVGTHVPHALRNADDLHDLMRTPEGREWWRTHGWEMDMSFDTRSGSRSTQVLDAYLRHRFGEGLDQ